VGEAGIDKEPSMMFCLLICVFLVPYTTANGALSMEKPGYESQNGSQDGSDWAM
jgi:hypothetical protein